MALTEDDLEQVAVELIDIGEFVATKGVEVQYMLYSQWFTYIYALWEESYRRRLANAHGSDSDGAPWTRHPKPLIWRHTAHPK